MQKNILPMKHTLLLTLVLFSTVCCSFIYSQNQAIAYSYDLMEVSFIAEINSGYAVVNTDYNEPYTRPHYIADTGESKPVAYISGSFPKLEVVIATDCDSVFVRGMNEYMTFTMPQGSPAAITGPEGRVSIAVTAIDSFEEGRIKFYENFIIQWEISKDGEMWMPLGESNNTLYVIVGGSSFFNHHFHTTYDIACRAANNLRGVTHDEIKNVVDVIFDTAFKKDNNDNFPELRRISDGTTLTYYGVHPSDVDEYFCPFNAALFLQTGDGRCGALTDFLIECIEVLGMDSDILEVYQLGVLPFPVDSSINGVIISDSGGVELTTTSKTNLVNQYENQFNEDFDMMTNLVILDYLFLVKNWNVANPGEFIPLYTGECSLRSQEIAQSAFGEPGIVGQGNVENPRSIFLNHVVAAYDNVILDPSYGTRYLDAANNSFRNTTQYENDSFDVATGAFIKREISANTCEYYYWVEKLNDIEEQDFFTY